MTIKDISDPSFDVLDELAVSRFMNWLEMSGPVGTIFRKDQSNALYACQIVTALSELTIAVQRVATALEEADAVD